MITKTIERNCLRLERGMLYESEMPRKRIRRYHRWKRMYLKSLKPKTVKTK